jgi:hypothetical protein
LGLEPTEVPTPGGAVASDEATLDEVLRFVA